MSSQQLQPGPVRAPPSSVPKRTPSQLPLQQTLDHGIWYALALWPALRTACDNLWGGAATLDKRDWFAGAVSDLLISQPSLDIEDLEAFLLQVMLDEFECNVEDESEVLAAQDLMKVWKGLNTGEGFEGAKVVEELEGRWRSRGLRKGEKVEVVEEDQDVDDDAEEEEWRGFDDDGDVNMANADMAVPDLVQSMPKHKVETQVDEDGFIKVVSRKKQR